MGQLETSPLRTDTGTVTDRRLCSNSWQGHMSSHGTPSSPPSAAGEAEVQRGEGAAPPPQPAKVAQQGCARPHPAPRHPVQEASCSPCCPLICVGRTPGLEPQRCCLQGITQMRLGPLLQTSRDTQKLQPWRMPAQGPKARPTERDRSSAAGPQPAQETQ